MSSQSFTGSEAYKGVAFDNILKCVHCGLCLDSCPTYRESGLEQDSPRGRLYIMNGVWRGELQFNEQNISYLDRCIDCRACETACPSKVPYGELIEKTRGILNQKFRKPSAAQKLQTFFYTKILPDDKILKSLSVLLKLYGFSGIKMLLKKNFFGTVLPKFIVKGQYMLPKFTGTSFKAKYKGLHPAQHKTANGIKTALFTGCIADVSDHEVHHNTVKLLTQAGYQVNVIRDQACCGALQVHGGDRETGRMLARKNIEAFADLNPDKIITNAAGCSAQLKEYHLLFDDEPQMLEKIRKFESKITDVVEFLGSTSGFVENLSWKTHEETVLYDAPCHLMHAQKIDKIPRALINSLPGVRLVPLTESDYCCGSGGIYNLLQSELADSILERKMSSLKETLNLNPQATTLVSGNPGCLFQIRYGVARFQIPIRVIHPVVYIAERLAD